MTTLDVGCGVAKKGEVNIDIDKNLKVDVIGDCCNLPFKNNSFDGVFCHHVIEHIKNPFRLMDELVRVTKRTIEIHCPYRLSYTAKLDPTHINFFNLSWFAGYAKNHQLKCQGVITIDDERPITYFKKFPFVLPLEIKVWLWKQ